MNGEPKSFLLGRVREESERVWQDQVCRWGIRLTAIMVVSSGLGVGVIIGKLPAQVPLWLSRPWGTAQLAQPQWVWLLPAMMAVIAGTTVVISGKVFSQEKLLARMTIWGGVLVEFLLTYALVRMAWLVL